MPSTIAIAPHKLTKEGRDLYDASKRYYERIILINPHKIWCYLVDRPNRAIVYHDGEDISNINALIVRGSGTYGAALCLLSAAMDINYCNVVDPPSRFSIGFASKVKSTFARYAYGVGSSSGFAFSLDGAEEMLTMLRKRREYPIIIKPIDGKRSRGRIVVKTSKRAKRIAAEFFEKRTSDDYPFFVQKYENIKDEYRVIVLNGEPIACVRKEKKKQTSRGSRFVRATDDMANAISMFVAGHVNHRGIYGVDAAVRKNNTLFIIEANRAPQWKRVQDVTGIDIGGLIVQSTLEQI